MAGKGAPKGNSYAKKGRGITISLYLKDEDMQLLRLVLAQHHKPTTDEGCVTLAKQAAKAGINRLLLPVKDPEVIPMLQNSDEKNS